MFPFFHIAFQIYIPDHKRCLTIRSDDIAVGGPCDIDDAVQKWSWINGTQLRNKNSGKCLDVDGEIKQHSIVRESICNKLMSGQIWSCSGGFIQVGETTLKLHLGEELNKPASLSYNTGPWNVWEIFGTAKNICAVKP